LKNCPDSAGQQATGQNMAKSKRDMIKLESTAGTGYFYVTTRNKRKGETKLELMKYDPKVRKHVLFKEKNLR
jgi:large subunit ribosomal protein L33